MNPFFGRASGILAVAGRGPMRSSSFPGEWANPSVNRARVKPSSPPMFPVRRVGVCRKGPVHPSREESFFCGSGSVLP